MERRSSTAEISESEAWAIAAHFGDEAAELLASNTLAVVVVGSLAAGNYTPGRSDIDLIIVARDECPDSKLRAISDMADRYWKETGIQKGFGGYGIRQGDLQPPFGALNEMAFEILQLKSGRVIKGELDLESIPEPSFEDMRRSLVASVSDILGSWRRPYPPPIDARDARANAILYWLRFLVWDRTGDYLLGKRRALGAALRLDEVAPIRALLGPVTADVTHEVDSPPDDAADICRQVEAFALQHIAWARDAASKVDRHD